MVENISLVNPYRKMKDAQTTQLAITGVVAETLGTPVEVHLAPHELTQQQRRQLYPQLNSRPTKKPRLLKSPCHIDISLRVDKFNRPTTKRSEAWLFIDAATKTEEVHLQFIDELQPVHVDVGQSFQLCCVVLAAPEPEVIWYKDDVELPIDGERFKVAKVPVDCFAVLDRSRLVLEVAKSQLSDEGSYKVSVTNTGGSLTSEATVTVRGEHPRFPLPIEPSVSARIGDDVTLRCRAVGVPLPEVTWLVLPDEVGGVEMEVKSTLGRYVMEKNVNVDDGVEFIEASLKISRIRVKDALMHWVCRASNEVGDASCRANIIVYSPARIVVPVPSTEVRRGRSAKLRCKAVGWPRPEITWSHADRPLDGAPRLSVVGAAEGGVEEVESTIEISEMTTMTAGLYTVTATNAWGRDSCQAQLTVEQEAPDFIEKFHDKTLEEGTRLCLVAKVTGIPFPSIKWLRNDVKLTDSKECAVELDDDVCRLTIERPRLEDGGRYSCVAENEAGIAKCTARIDVKQKPVKPLIVKAPEDQTAVEQEKYSFEAEITGIPQPNVQWFKKGELLAESASVVYGNRGTIYTLSVDNASLDDAGPFSVKASNLVGETTATARLQVKERTEKPVILRKPADQEITEGESGIFEVSVTGKPEPTVTWYMGSVLLAPTEVIQLEKVDTRHILKINNAELHHAGLYTVKASNTDGEISAVARLIVNEKLISPVYIEEMSDHEVFENEQVLFRCTVLGKPLPRIKWFAGDAELFTDEQVETHSEKLGANELLLQLQVRSASLSDTGEFKVVATNAAGTATSVSKLVVKMRMEKPLLMRKPVDQEITEGDEAIFEVEVIGKPEPVVSWYCGSTPLKATEHFHFGRTCNSYQLSVRKAELHHAGQYTAKAVNLAGEISSSASLFVNEKLIAPFFSNKMADQEVMEIDPIHLECTVHGKPLPRVKWFNGETELFADKQTDIKIEKLDETSLRLQLRIGSATMSDAGQFKVVATNTAGMATCSSVVIVNMRTEKPTVLKQLVDQTITEGESCHFETTVAGKPVPRVQWLKDDRVIVRTSRVNWTENVTEHLLKIDEATLDDAGRYSARIFNIAGEETTAAGLVVLERQVSPVFTRRHVDQTVIEESTAHFTCRAKGKPLPDITWYLNEELIEQSAAVQLTHLDIVDSGEREAALTLNSVSLDDSAIVVKAVATNAVGKADASARLNVEMRTEKPEIFEKPIDQEITEGEDAMFQVVVTGRPEPTINWYYGGDLLKSSDCFDCEKSANVHRLRVKEGELHHAGAYTAKAVNLAGETSASATLVVKEKMIAPVFTERMADLTVTEGELVNFKCTVTGKPLPRIKWYKGEVEFFSDEHIKTDSILIQPNEVSLSMFLHSAELSDAGEYKAIATNTAGTASVLSILKVNEKLYPPVFTLKPVTQELLEDDVAEFHCIIEGKPLPTVSWSSGSKELKADVRTAVECVRQDQRSAVRATLRVIQLTIDDAGEIQVVAKNSVGEATAATRLAVKLRTVQPLFIKELLNQEITEDDYCAFEVEVSGKPEPTVQWFKDDAKLEESDRIRMVSDANCHLLVIAKAQLSDAARYSIRAANIVGEKTSSATLVVNERHWPPTIIEELSDVIDAIEEGLVKMNCRISAKPKPDIAWILNNKQLIVDKRIQLTTIDEEDNHFLTSLVIDPSAIEDSGEVIVVATNDYGQECSTAKLIINVRTERPMFLEPLRDQEAYEEEDCSFQTEISGKPIPEVQWYKSDKKLVSSASIDVVKDGTRHEIRLKKVALDSAGSYTVRASNMAGEVFATAILRVNERLHRPSFVQELKNQEAIEGDNVCFECQVEGKPLPEITWSVGGVEVKPSGKLRTKYARQSDTLLSASLSIDLAAMEDSGEIEAIARNLAGEAASSATLAVQMRTEKPLIVKGPIDLDIIEGDGCRFDATITGKPQPEVEWFRAEKKLEPSDGVVMERSATQYSLRMPTVNIEHGDRYMVKASNVAGTATAVATLRVAERQVAPSFTVPLSNREAVEDEGIEFECSVTGKPLPKLTWFKDDKEMVVADRIKLNSRQDPLKGLFQTLRIDGLSMSDGGEIKAIAENPAGTAVSRTRLTVNMRTEKPVILMSPSSQEIIEGQLFQFQAVVSGRPEPVVQWLKDGAKISPSPHITIEGVAPKYSLTVNEARQRDRGRYTVRASNVAGEDTVSAELTIVESYFNRMLENACVSEGMSATFECEVFPAKAKITWFIDGVAVVSQTEVGPDYDGIYRATADVETGERRLTFIRAMRKDAGCRVTAAVGELESHAELLVEASDTEVVESRLFYEIENDRTRRVAAEFLCHHGDGSARIPETPSGTPMIEVRGLNNPEMLVASDVVQKPKQRRWVVRKAYVDRGAGHPGLVTVDRWDVNSYVDYTCGPEILENVRLGILDDVTFTQQTVEFVVVLSAKAEDVVWLKDARQVAPLDRARGDSRSASLHRGRRGSVPSKYSSSIDDSGLTYTLVVNDVNVGDEGIYTFVVRRPDDVIEQRDPKITYRIEGSSDQANEALLLKSLAERKHTPSGTTSTTNIAASRSHSQGGTTEYNAALRRRMIDRADSATASSLSSTLQQQLAAGGETPSELSQKESDLQSGASFWSQIHEIDRRAAIELESMPTGNDVAHFDDDDGEVISSSDITGIPAVASPGEQLSRSVNNNSSVADADLISMQIRRPSGNTSGERSINYPERSQPMEFTAQRFNRSKSMSSSEARSLGAGGRRKSEILYFSYTESRFSGADV